MTHGTLEHANLTVSDPERSARFLAKLCGWHERWRGPSQLGGFTIHVGNASDYLALYCADPDNLSGPKGYAKGAPLNHLGLLVDDLDAAEKIVLEEGFETFSHGDYEPGRRFYFFDWDGIEFEIISYAGRTK